MQSLDLPPIRSGFRRLRDFIVTQHPLTHTIKDFWQMVWDHNAQTVVLLSALDDAVSAQQLRLPAVCFVR